MWMRYPLSVAVTLALAAGPALAQGQGHGGMHSSGAETTPMGGMMQMMAQMGPGMMGGGMISAGPGPEELIRAKDLLELTEEQVGRLEQLSEETARRQEGFMAAMASTRNQVRELLAADSPDIEAVQAAMRAMHSAMQGGHLLVIETAIRARAVLTPEQRAGLDQARELGAGSMPCGMMGSGMMGGGMLGGGMMGSMPHGRGR